MYFCALQKLHIWAALGWVGVGSNSVDQVYFIVEEIGLFLGWSHIRRRERKERIGSAMIMLRDRGRVSMVPEMTIAKSGSLGEGLIAFRLGQDCVDRRHSATRAHPVGYIR